MGENRGKSEKFQTPPGVKTWQRGKKSADLFCAIKTKFVAWFSHGCLENELWKNREKFQKVSKKWKSVEEKQKI